MSINKIVPYLSFSILYILLCSFNHNSISQKNPGFHMELHHFQKDPRGMVFIPKGHSELIRTIDDSTNTFVVSLSAFWMKETEVTVMEYMDYLESLMKDSSELVYKKAYPTINELPFEDYLTNKNYIDYPIVGINLQQAKDYCCWLTRKESQKLQEKGSKLIHKYRIPTEAEWIYASLAGMNPGSIEKPDIEPLSHIGTDKPNEWGLWNMFNNVSEWTATFFDPHKYLVELNPENQTETGQVIVCGNNFKNTLNNEKAILDSNIGFDFVGFRYIRSYEGKSN